MGRIGKNKIQHCLVCRKIIWNRQPNAKYCMCCVVGAIDIRRRFVTLIRDMKKKYPEFKISYRLNLAYNKHNV